MADRYNVAFVYTRKAGAYEGIVTWSSYDSKEHFEQMRAAEPEDVREKTRIVEQGVSDQRCIELVKQTPRACYASAAVQEATRKDGSIDREVLQMEFTKLAFMNIYDDTPKA